MKGLSAIDSAVLLTLFSLFLYGSSAAYLFGYASEFSLDYDVLDIPFHNMAYHGVLLNLYMLLYISLSVSLVVLINRFFLFEISCSISKKFDNGRKLVRLKNKFFSNKKGRKKTSKDISDRAFKSLLVFMSIIGFWLIISFHMKAGASDSKDLMKDIESGTGTYSKLYVNLDGVEKEYAHLYCGTRNCAGYDVENKRVFYFPQTGHAVKVWKEESQLATESTPAHPEREAVEGSS